MKTHICVTLALLAFYEDIYYIKYFIVYYNGLYLFNYVNLFYSLGYFIFVILFLSCSVKVTNVNKFERTRGK